MHPAAAHARGHRDARQQETTDHVPLTGSLSVIGHELSHAVVQFSGGLVYRDQSGALNESFADVFGALATQFNKKQSAAEAD